MLKTWLRDEAPLIPYWVLSMAADEAIVVILANLLSARWCTAICSATGLALGGCHGPYVSPAQGGE